MKNINLDYVSGKHGVIIMYQHFYQYIPSLKDFF